MKVDVIGKQLLFVTVYIETLDATGQPVASGTGFVLESDRSGLQNAPVIVTNRHVVDDGSPLVRVHFIAEGEQGRPGLGNRESLTMEASLWTGHPDANVDVAVMPLIPLQAQLSGPIFYRSIGNDSIPSRELVEELDAYLDVAFVGYPNGIYDQANLTPIIRRGTTATPVELDYDGRPVFLIDASVFGGSSGSPVFLMQLNGYVEKGSMMVGASRVLWLGLVAETKVRNQLGQLVVSSPSIPRVLLRQEINLGVVFRYEAVEAAIEAMYRQWGQPRPTSVSIDHGA